MMTNVLSKCRAFLNSVVLLYLLMYGSALKLEALTFGNISHA